MLNSKSGIEQTNRIDEENVYVSELCPKTSSLSSKPDFVTFQGAAVDWRLQQSTLTQIRNLASIIYWPARF